MNNPRSIPARVRRVLAHPATDVAVAVLIVASIVVLVAEAAAPDSAALRAAGAVVLVLFAVEMAARFVAAASKASFFRNWWLDLLSLLPLVAPQFEILRILRVLRLLRLAPLLMKSNRRFGSLFRQTTRQQITVLSVMLIVVLGATLAFREIEGGESFADVYETFWFSLLSLMSGEPMWPDTPVTPAGRVFTLVIMVGGLTVFAVFTGTVSAYMADRFGKGFRIGLMDLDELADHIVVCGWNRSAKVLLEELQGNPDMRNKRVLVVAEKRPDFGETIESNPRFAFLEGDYTTLDVLKRARIPFAATAILLADRSVPSRSDQDRDARTILASLMIEKLNPDIFTCAELLSRANEVHLRLAGIEEVVIGDEYSATILATSSRVRGVTQIADEIFSNKVGNQIYKRDIRPEWVGTTFLALQSKVKTEYDALAMAIEKAPPSRDARPDPNTAYSRTITNPPANYALQAGDRLIVLAREEPKW